MGNRPPTVGMLYPLIAIAALLSTSCSFPAPLNLDDIPATVFEAESTSRTTPAPAPAPAPNDGTEGSKTSSAPVPSYTIRSSIGSQRADTGAWDINTRVYQHGLEKITPFTGGFSDTFNTHKRGCYSQEKPDYNVTFEVFGAWGALENPLTKEIYLDEQQVRHMLIQALAATLEALSAPTAYDIYTNCVGGSGSLGHRGGASLNYFCPDNLDVDCGVLTGCGWNPRGGQTVPQCSSSCPQAADPNGELGPCFTTRKGLILPTEVGVYVYEDVAKTTNEMHIRIRTEQVEPHQKCSMWLKMLYASLNFASGWANNIMKATVYLSCAQDE